MIITKHDIEHQEPRSRAAFVNSLAEFRQAVLIGSKGADGSPNLAIFGLINRPDSVPRNTIRNTRETGEYSVNAVWL